MELQEELEYQTQFQDPQLFMPEEAEVAVGITQPQELVEMVAVETVEDMVMEIQEQLTLVVAVEVVDLST
jgi:hypothetical protein